MIQKSIPEVACVVVETEFDLSLVGEWLLKNWPEEWGNIPPLSVVGLYPLPNDIHRM